MVSLCACFELARSSFLFLFIFLVKLVATLVIRPIVNINAAVSIRTVARFKVRFAKLRVMVNPGRRTYKTGCHQRSKRPFKSLGLQLLLSLGDVCGIALFSSVKLRIELATLNCSGDCLLLLGLLQRSNFLCLLTLKHNLLFLPLWLYFLVSDRIKLLLYMFSLYFIQLCMQSFLSLAPVAVC